MQFIPVQSAKSFGGEPSDGELVGSVTAFAGNTLPEGWLLCNGAAVSKITYAALFDVIGATYGSGDGSTTFNLPNLSDKFIEGSATAGTVKSAGLPNITGNAAANVVSHAASDSGIGALSFSYGGKSGALGAGSSMPYGKILFDASASSSIYGNSTTVQPPALTMKFAIYSGVVSKKLWLRII